MTLPTESVLTLSQYNNAIAALLSSSPAVQRQWVQAEISDLRETGGNCYMELIEKNPDTGETLARVPAAIWRSVFGALHRRFVDVTGNRLANGMKVLVRVTASFHRVYGLRSVIDDINPEFTLGDMARRRKAIIDRLTAEGIISLNRDLPWPVPAQRVAIVSAQGAAGYGDFVNQLDHNPHGLVFYHHLFEARMQGENTVPTMLAALQRVAACHNLFDCVVIIRGGGSTSDLNAFDDYTLAAAIARFPLPVVTGIGHERDVTVLDHVARRVKTPTAAAELLINGGAAALARLADTGHALSRAARELLSASREQLAHLTTTITGQARHQVEAHGLRLQALRQLLPQAVAARLQSRRQQLDALGLMVRPVVTAALERHHTRLAALNDKVTLLSPRNILNRGYALVMQSGRFVTDASTVAPGSTVTVHLSHGRLRATVDDNTQPHP